MVAFAARAAVATGNNNIIIHQIESHTLCECDWRRY